MVSEADSKYKEVTSIIGLVIKKELRRLKTTLDKIISQNQKGLFLLDSPTGFGKTTAVLEILKEFLCGKSHKDVKRMFFVTNLKTNLPFDVLVQQLNISEKENCVWIHANEDEVINNWNKINIFHKEIKLSEEYRNLNSDIEILNDLISEREKLKKQNLSVALKEKSIKSFRNKIATITEPCFRRLINKKYLEGKSVVDKKQFVKENLWLRKLYPISELESKKVIFMTTAKFFSPISVFYRMPFYMYDDPIINDSVIFIDEFDGTKQVILNQIIENSLKINIDIISLFTNIHHVLQNTKFPAKLFTMAENKEANNNENYVDEELTRYTSQKIIELNKDKFKEIYEKHDFQYLLKSYEFLNSKSFIFDDGNNITVYNDNSKRYFNVRPDEAEQHLRLTASQSKIANMSFNELLKDVLYCVNYFAKGVRMLALNYFQKINNVDGKFEYKYTLDEALMTVLATFNLNGENRDYIRNILTDGRYKVASNNRFTRKGFNFTEIEDSNYHDLQTVAHQFSLEATPENLIIIIAERAKLIGISATASIETVIGNFDLQYIKEVLGNKYIEINNEDFVRIKDSFADSQIIYDQVNIEVNVVDDLNAFSDFDKITTLLNKIYKSDTLNKYLTKMSLENFDSYYFLMAVKLAFTYCEVGKKNIKSFIVFQNRIPRDRDEKLSKEILTEMFIDAARCNDFKPFSWFAVSSDSFEDDMREVYEMLSMGKKVFVITTYQTVGSGKNIQYKIPQSEIDNIIMEDKIKQQKDFDGIYLMTPTNLTQYLNEDSDNKYRDLTRYLYQQQSLRLNDSITRGQFRINVISGFRRIFYKDKYSTYYNRNSDLCLHSTQLAIQAVGRICRCKNKNKNIFIYSDLEIINRIQDVNEIIGNRILNAEFIALLHKDIQTEKIESVSDYSQKNKKAYGIITKGAYTVRNSPAMVREWESLRNYVLCNPTAETVVDKYRDLYFEFKDKTRGYAFEEDYRHSLTNIILDTRVGTKQVSMDECELPLLLSIPYIKTMFYKNKYAHFWQKETFVMCPNLFRQVYLGALGEVVGREILYKETGYECEELVDYKMFELFDYKLKNIYIDFKHWKDYKASPLRQIEKILRKLDSINGEKAIIINIVKRGNHIEKETINGDVIVIPYLIDPATGEISENMIEVIQNAIIKPVLV